MRQDDLIILVTILTILICWMNHDKWICETMLVCLHDGIIIVCNIEWFIMMDLFDVNVYEMFKYDS